MKIAICEDNEEEADWLKRVIEAWAMQRKNNVQISLFPTTEAFLFCYEEETFDVLFLDIQMPGEDGISLAQRLRGRKDAIPIIFVTGLDEYISVGYEVEAVHYLIKPVKVDKVRECLERVCQRLMVAEPYLVLHIEEGIKKVFLKDIIKIEVFSRQCVYTTLVGEYAVMQSLKEAERELDSDKFVLCYRGVLVNLQHIEAIDHNKVELVGGITAPVSRRMYGELNQRFIAFFRRD